jgi:flagellar protein FlgJ
MEISGINSRLINNTINAARSKASEESFETLLQEAVERNDQKELKKVCREFEGLVLRMMFRQMKQTVPKSELVPEDAARDIFETMLDDSLVDEIVKGSGIGLGDALYKQLGSRQGTLDPKKEEGER